MAKKQSWSAMDKSNTPFEQLKRAFALYNRTTNKSPRTVDWYEERLEMYARFIGADGTLADFNIASARAFIADLQSRTTKNPNNPKFKGEQRSLSSSYIQSFARALRAFSTWLHEDGYTDTNLLKPLKPPKVQQKVVEVLSEKQIQKLVAACDRNDPFGARDYAIFYTLLDAGLRASELADLTVANARLQEGFVKVLGKGNKERLIPIGRRTQEALQVWLERFRPSFDSEDEQPHVFLGASGTRLTVTALEQMVRRRGHDAGIEGLHPHRLRHTMATRFLTLGLGDTFQLQQLLGHTSLEMVRRYVSLASIEKAIMERRPSAMDRLGEVKSNGNLARRIQPKRRPPLKHVNQQNLPALTTVK